MNKPMWGVSMEIEFRLTPTQDGGRKTSIVSGYRPNVIVKSATGDDVIFGLAELDLAQPVQPGASSRGVLRFDQSISPLVRTHLRVDSEFALSEGKWIVATARVLSLS